MSGGGKNNAMFGGNCDVLMVVWWCGACLGGLRCHDALGDCEPYSFPRQPGRLGDRSPDGAGEGREGLLEALRRVRLQRRLRRAFAADSVKRGPTRGANPFSASKRPAVLQPAGGERQARSNASGEPFFRIEMASCAGPAAASNLRLGSGSLPLGGVGIFGCPFYSEPNQFELLVQSSTSPYSS